MTSAKRPRASARSAPAFRTLDEYRARLGDPAFWTPYVMSVLRRHELPVAQVETGTVGTFPTFLVGQSVIKLFTPNLAKPFGTLFDGTRCHQVELAVLDALAEQPAIPRPALVASGRLFGVDEDAQSDVDSPWPYLVTTRLSGLSWRQAHPSTEARTRLAHQLGVTVRQVHALPPPTGPIWERDWITEFRGGCVERQRRWGTLPPHLIDQIDAYLIDPLSDRRLVHADLHADHIFIDGARLVGLIDWGDALVADPYYELPALHLHAFDADGRVLAAFLEGYGWPVDTDFTRRAMSMTLLREFDVMDGVARRVDLQSIASLEELADLVWGLP